jgi:hypothetical protein
MKFKNNKKSTLNQNYIVALHIDLFQKVRIGSFWSKQKGVHCYNTHS